MAIFLSGNDEQKTVILKALASADYLNVEWIPIPERYQTTLVDTKSNDTALFTGILHSVDVDLMGLVWEWCADWFGNYPAKKVTDPAGPARQPHEGRAAVARGTQAGDGLR